MSRVRLRPTLDDLQRGDAYLPEFLRYIEYLVGDVNREQAARNAALAYFALVRGMSNKGLIQMDWALSLMIDIDDTEYEVRSFVDLLDSADVVEIILDADDEASAELLSKTPSEVTSKPTDISSLVPAEVKARPHKKVHSFLESLEHGSLPRISERELASPLLVDPISSALVRDVRYSISEPTTEQAIFHGLNRVGVLEQSYDRLSQVTNHAYWRLGVAYQEFCMVGYLPLNQTLH